MKLKVTLVMDKLENLHVFPGNVQRQIFRRLDHDVLLIGNHGSLVCYRVGTSPWFRFMHNVGPTIWRHLQTGTPYVTEGEFPERDFNRLTTGK